MYGNSNTNALLSAIQAAQERRDSSGEIGIPSEDAMDEMEDDGFALAQMLSSNRKNELEQLSQLTGAGNFCFSPSNFSRLPMLRVTL